MIADYPIIHGEALPPTEECPGYPHEEHGAEWVAAKLNRGRRCCAAIRARNHTLLDKTLDAIERALMEDDRLRALQKERLKSLKESTK